MTFNRGGWQALQQSEESVCQAVNIAASVCRVNQDAKPGFTGNTLPLQDGLDLHSSQAEMSDFRWEPSRAGDGKGGEEPASRLQRR